MTVALSPEPGFVECSVVGTVFIAIVITVVLRAIVSVKVEVRKTVYEWMICARACVCVCVCVCVKLCMCDVCAYLSVVCVWRVVENNSKSAHVIQGKWICSDSCI